MSQKVASPVNTTYYASYEDVNVHELMIKDKPRTDAYLNAIKQNKHLFEDKIVLDVGCGTGILSLFAAKYGKAKRVFAVEASNMAKFAQLIVQQNQLQDVITVVQGPVETVALPGVQKVDIIISEWMGFYLLHESMLDSVLVARDRFLNKETGIVFPSKARIYSAPCTMVDHIVGKFGFWEDVYGFDFSPILSLVSQDTFSKPHVEILQADQLLSAPVLVKEMDCKTIQSSELRAIELEHQFEATKDGILHGFCTWFDVDFQVDQGPLVRLSTGPMDEPTHWKQTTIVLPQAFQITKGQKIPARLSLVSDMESENYRHYSISVEVQENDDEEDDALLEDAAHEASCDCARCKVIRAMTDMYDNQE